MAVIGAGMVPPAPHDLAVLHVSCEGPGPSGGALAAAWRQVEQLLGEEILLPEPGWEPLEPGPRHRFLGDLPWQPIDARLVEACNRLVDRAERRVALAFEALDVADQATVATLDQILKRPGWLRLPLILTVRGTPQGLVAELIYLLSHIDGETGVIELDDETASDEATAPFEWAVLPADVLRVLRAGAILGTTFEAELVARLLDEPLGAVLEKLQWAADAGAPLADRGEGRFTLPAETITALQRRMLPSLLTFWHTRLGELLSSRRSAAGVAPGTQHGADLPGREPRTVPRSGHRAAPVEARVATPPSDTEADTPVRRPPARYADLFEAAPPAGPPDAMPPAPMESAEVTGAPGADLREEPVRPRQMSGRAASPADLARDPTRAATHLQAAGRTEAAVEHYLTAVREMATHGDARRAYSLAEQALKLLDELPTSNQRALLRAQLWMEKGRLQWHGALLGAPFTLHEALASLDTAASVLPPDTPPDMVGPLAAVTAGICYDLGDPQALQRALEVLTASSRLLLNSGEPLLAARLLNDQAAVYVRLGDPVRATHLLTKSRELFEGRLRTNPNDTMAIEEQAATDHLLARLLLHVQMRPGREEDAYGISLEHARAAERAYQRLGQRRQLAHVWETMGRLALQRGQRQEAQERLTAALELQRQVGDITGLARSTGTLAELFVMAGRLGEAVALLTDSITLNYEKGSLIGLAFNRRTLTALTNATAQAPDPQAQQVRDALAALESRLAQAEAVFGRLVLPGEAG